MAEDRPDIKKHVEQKSKQAKTRKSSGEMKLEDRERLKPRS